MEMVVFIFVIILLLKGRFGWALFITFIFIFFPPFFMLMMFALLMGVLILWVKMLFDNFFS